MFRRAGSYEARLQGISLKTMNVKAQNDGVDFRIDYGYCSTFHRHVNEHIGVLVGIGKIIWRAG